MSISESQDLSNLSIDQLNEILISKQQILHKIKRQLNSLPISNVNIYNKPEQQLKHVILTLNTREGDHIPKNHYGDRDELLRERTEQYSAKLLEQEETLTKLTKERDYLNEMNEQLRLHGYNNLLIDCKERLQDIEDQIERQHQQDGQISLLKAQIKEKEDEMAKLQAEAHQMQLQVQAMARQYEVEEQVLRSQMNQKSEKRQENIMSKYETDEKTINDSLTRQLNEQEQQLSALEEKYMDLEKTVKANNEIIERKEQAISLIQAETEKVSWEINGAAMQLQSALSIIQMLQLDVEITQSRVDTLNTTMNDIEEMTKKVTQLQEDAIIDLNKLQLFLGSNGHLDA